MKNDNTEQAPEKVCPKERVVMLPLPKNTERMESGPVMFGNDWPGIFIRGDSAFAYSLMIDDLLKAADQDKLNVIVAAQAENAVKLFRSCIDA